MCVYTVYTCMVALCVRGISKASQSSSSISTMTTTCSICTHVWLCCRYFRYIFFLFNHFLYFRWYFSCHSALASSWTTFPYILCVDLSLSRKQYTMPLDRRYLSKSRKCESMKKHFVVPSQRVRPSLLVSCLQRFNLSLSPPSACLCTLSLSVHAASRSLF